MSKPKEIEFADTTCPPALTMRPNPTVYVLSRHPADRYVDAF
jgi:hypothetical protein